MTATIDKFIANLHESKLLSPARVEQAKEKFVSSGRILEVETFSNYLVDEHLLTPWQKSYLLKGKTKGFFLGPYKILKIIGRGGNSFVYAGEHIRLKQLRALKVLARTRTRGQEGSSVKRFVREARETAKLDHPNVIKCYDIGVKGELYYLVLEYVKGTDLHKVVSNKGPLSFDLVASCIFQAAQGLRYIKQNGLIHRDIKPGNIFATKSGTIKILDLGLALLDRNDNFDPSITIMHNDNIGTADYLAPEQALNSHHVDHRVDIYGLGCTMYFLLVGHAPFPEGTVVQRIAKHQAVMPQDIMELRPDCPRALRDLCWKMIQKSPDARVQSYDEIINQIKQWRSGTSQSVNSDSFSAQMSMPLDDMPSFNPNDPLELGDISQYAIDAPDPADHTMVGALHSPETMPLNSFSTDTDTRQQARAAVGQAQAPARPPQGGYWKNDDKESDAYKRFIARERLKTIWVFVGFGLGIAIAIATVVVMRTTEKVIEDAVAKPPVSSRDSD